MQCTVLLAIVYTSLKLGTGTWDAFLPMLGTMIPRRSAPSPWGSLFISSVVTSAEAGGISHPIACSSRRWCFGGLLVPMTNKWLVQYL